jgi:hypothetical protein
VASKYGGKSEEDIYRLKDAGYNLVRMGYGFAEHCLKIDLI